jgi:hypothetical protein
MIQVQFTHACRAVLVIGLLLVSAGCSSRQPDETTRVNAISKAVGFALPADAAILAYRHQHNDKNASQCSQLWVVEASVPFAGPDRRVNQTRAKSPFKSLKLLVKHVTNGRVVIEAADGTACQCVEWQNGETMCRLRQTQTRTGWVAALEAILPQ